MAVPSYYAGAKCYAENGGASNLQRANSVVVCSLSPVQNSLFAASEFVVFSDDDFRSKQLKYSMFLCGRGGLSRVRTPKFVVFCGG
jgi:hypothetical protein